MTWTGIRHAQDVPSRGRRVRRTRCSAAVGHPGQDGRLGWLVDGSGFGGVRLANQYHRQCDHGDAVPEPERLHRRWAEARAPSIPSGRVRAISRHAVAESTSRSRK